MFVSNACITGLLATTVLQSLTLGRVSNVKRIACGPSFPASVLKKTVRLMVVVKVVTVMLQKCGELRVTVE